MQSLTETVDYHPARESKLIKRLAVSFNTVDIKQIHQRTGLNHVVFTGSPVVSSKTVEA